MKKEISIRIDRDIADQAEDIFNSIGLDSEMALTMFLRRTVVEGKIPFSMEPVAKKSSVSRRHSTEDSGYYSASPDRHAAWEQGYPSDDIAALFDSAPAKRSRGMDEGEMQAIWETFMRIGGADCHHSQLRRAASMVSVRTGMNLNTALMRLTFLHNLVNGKPNSTNLAVKYLRVFMDYIEKDLGAKYYINALESLGDSMPNWRNKGTLGNYANEVADYVTELSSSL